MYSDTRSQVYRGAAAETPQTNAAVAATAGQIVTYGGQPAITYFFASSGGMTERHPERFPGSAPEPWLRGVPDPYDSGPPSQLDACRMSFRRGRARLRGLVKGAFRGIEVLRARRLAADRLRATCSGRAGTTLVSGPELAARLGLYDTWAYFSVRSGTTVSRRARPQRPAPDRARRPPRRRPRRGAPRARQVGPAAASRRRAARGRPAAGGAAAPAERQR